MKDMEIELTDVGKEMQKKRQKWMGYLDEKADEKLMKELKVSNINELIDYFRRPAKYEGKRKVRDTGREVLNQYLKDPAFDRVKPLLQDIKEFLKEEKNLFGVELKLEEKLVKETILPTIKPE